METSRAVPSDSSLLFSSSNKIGGTVALVRCSLRVGISWDCESLGVGTGSREVDSVVVGVAESSTRDSDDDFESVGSESEFVAASSCDDVGGCSPVMVMMRSETVSMVETVSMEDFDDDGAGKLEGDSFCEGDSDSTVDSDFVADSSFETEGDFELVLVSVLVSVSPGVTVREETEAVSVVVADSPDRVLVGGRVKEPCFEGDSPDSV